MYKRVLLKLSGEALSANDDILATDKLDALAKEIKEVVEHKTQVSIVVGGGNIYRGKLGEKLGMDRNTGDSMGMLATCLNALAIKNALIHAGVDAVVLTSFNLMPLAEQFSPDLANNYLNNNKVVIYGGGTGSSYFSTDTCSALRALQTKCDAILMAKNGVDGVYDSDPRVNKNAKMFDKISYQEVIEKNLQVMDLTAVTLCKENNMPLIVFNMNKDGNIAKVINNEKLGTIVK